MTTLLAAATRRLHRRRRSHDWDWWSAWSC